MRKLTASLAIALTCGCATVVEADDRTVAVPGTELPYVELGSGSPVIFVHGAISDHRAWDPYRESIASQHRFISYDQRYFGLEDWRDDGEEFSADTHAADLIAVTETLGNGPVNLVAWSYGGDVAARAAIARPDLFSAIVLYEPSLKGLIDGLPNASDAIDEFYSGFGSALKAVDEGRLEDASLRFIEAVFDLSEGDANLEPEQWQHIWQENGRTIPAFLTAPKGNVATCEKLASLNIPILVVQGSESFAFYTSMAGQFAACAGNAMLVSLDNANHDGPYRQPGRFGSMINAFLNLTE